MCFAKLKNNQRQHKEEEEEKDKNLPVPLMDSKSSPPPASPPMSNTPSSVPPRSSRSSISPPRIPPPMTHSPPPTLIPSSGLSMVSMASMIGSHHPPHPSSLLMGSHLYGAGGRGSGDDFMHRFMDRSFGVDSSPPPATVPTNDPTANECKIVDYRGEKVAAFMINGKTMLCLPQAFELFLKHLVGGLHTVYTKLKRLEITPMVCNVEQVRILRGLGAIQPGVNRCKLLADVDFDTLYKDCTTSSFGRHSSSRPGRPPKRGVPFPPMSPQDAMLHLKQTMQHHHNGGLGLDTHYGKEPRLDKSPFPGGFPHAAAAAAAAAASGAPHLPSSSGAGGVPPGLSPMAAAQFMALGGHPAFLGQGLPPHFLPVTSSQHGQSVGGGGGGGGSGAGQPPRLPVSSSMSAGGLDSVSGRIPPGLDHQNFMKAAGLSSLEALQRSGLFGAAYLERVREGQRDQERALAEHLERERRSSQGKDDNSAGSPVLTPPSSSTPQKASDRSLTNRTESPEEPGSEDRHKAPVKPKAVNNSIDDIATDDDDDDDDIEDVDDDDDELTNGKNKTSDKTNNNRNKSENNNNNNNVSPAVSSAAAAAAAQMSGLAGLATLAASNGGENAGQLYGLIGNIQALLKMAVENAKQEERSAILSQKADAKTEPPKDSLQQELEELKKNAQMYLSRIKKEKKYRKKLQEQLEQETKKRVQMEEALRMTSSETLKRITESLQREMEEQQKKKQLIMEKQQQEKQQQDDRRSLSDDEDGDEDAADAAATNTESSNSRHEEDDSEENNGGHNRRRRRTSRVRSEERSRAKSGSGSDDQQQQQQQEFNAKVSATAETGSNRSDSPPRETPTIGFAKNLFPFNGSSLFTSAN